jgi:hypothetical protein
MNPKESIKPLDIGLYKVPLDNPNFNKNHHTFGIGVCNPIKYDDPIWEQIKSKSKGPIEEAEEKAMKESIGTDKCYIGFDTEYTNLKDVLNQTAEDSKKNLYLSYQFSAQWKGCRWEGVGFPKDGHRISMDEFICWVMSECPLLKEDKDILLPHSVFLICHYSRADLPSFRGFFDKNNRINLMNLRRTLVTMRNGAPIKIPVNYRGKKTVMSLGIRDTFLLAPSTAKSLDSIGSLIGIEKKTPKEYLSRMDELRKDDLQRFIDYAQTDATIALKFSENISELSSTLGGDAFVPLTLTSLGISFLQQLWKDNGFNTNEILGKIKETFVVRNKKTGNPNRKSKLSPNTFRHLYANLATECYHGGRNEQYFFGVGDEGDWYDYDLSSAYPTGMSQLGTPLWEQSRPSTDIDELIKHRLSFALVEFKHPEGTRFPVLPVRGADSVLFPLEGQSHCCGPELRVAKSLGVEMNVLFGVYIPEKKDQPFGEYLQYCIKRRKEAKEEGNQVLQQLWKELANSMYGKLAQGLRKRNVFNVSKLESEELPECKITTPFYAAYTTSFCRAVLGEILNKLPKSVAVCSCTTDGFLCTADADQIKKATSGPLSKEFLKARQYFNPNEKSILEVKSVIRKPLGWRTRGQATLLPKNLKESDTFVLAKAGLKPEAYDKLEQNKWIIETFEKRFFGQKYAVRSFVSVRDMFEDESDLYSINSDKAISMDFDWKRRPVMDLLEMRKVRTSHHVFFDTTPWKTAKESEVCKDDWKKFAELHQRCLKTEEDVREFIEFYTHRASLPKVEGRNNPRKGNIPFRKFKIWFARAYANGAYGLPPKTDGKRPSYEKLDVFFSQRGLKGMRGALSNYRTDDVDPPNQTPRSVEMEKIVTDLLELFPNFEVDSIFITVS